jgi:hypothetical protein
MAARLLRILQPGEAAMTTSPSARRIGMARIAIAMVVLAIGCTGVAGAQSPPPAAAGRAISGAWEPLRGGPGAPPPTPPSPITLKAPYAAEWQARRSAQDEATRKGEPLATGGSQCIPYGVPTMMSIANYPVEILQTPAQVTIITEAFSEVRRVYLDRPQLKIDEVPPGYYGRSVGKWDGDTLVVDTIGIAPKVAGYQSLPHSNQLRVTERIRLTGPDVLQDQVTLDDPVVLEKPVTYTLAYKRLPNYEMVEFVCDNNREFTDDNGVVRMKVLEK